MNKTGVFFLAVAAAAQEPAPDAVFKAGTRLVQVEVVVRGQRARPPGLGQWFAWVLDSGPPWGPPGEPIRSLTKDDFTLLDNGKPRPIAAFSAGPRNQAKPMAVPPGAVSNRTDDRGQALNGATVVLVDFLNTGWLMSDYLRLGFKNLLHALEPNDKIAVYTLGKKLHVVQDFTDDPHRLMDIAVQLDKPHAELPPEFRSALWDYGPPPTAHVDPRESPAITLTALKVITQHLSGVPGRKNLVWVGGHPSNATIAAFQQAGIVVYPVSVRSVDTVIHTEMPSGGRRFLDAMDLTYAVRTAEEDSGVAYVLGYYPTEDALDGKYHEITVKLNDAELRKQDPELHYRAGYLATKVDVLPPAPSLAEAFSNSLDSTAIGLAGQITFEAGRPRPYDLRVTVDLRDIHLERKNGRFTGGFDYAVSIPSSAGTFKTGSVSLSLTDQEFADTLEHGLTLVVKEVEPESGKIHLVVQDRATGVAGSIRIPVPQ
jgi:hypothetical protein